MKILLAFASLILLSGCSNKQVYTAIQNNQRFECSKLPEAQATECMRQYEASYEDYDEAREDLAREQR